MLPISAPVVTVVVDGVPVIASVPAVLRDGVVVAPAEPYLRDVADRTTLDVVRLRLTLERDERSVALPLSPASLADGAEPAIGLAATARALGADVAYDAVSHTLEIYLPHRKPLATVAPSGPATSAPYPVVTFSPQPVSTPMPAITGIPQPRRTPILVREPLRP
jgi:hypothetical protein